MKWLIDNHPTIVIFFFGFIILTMIVLLMFVCMVEVRVWWRKKWAKIKKYLKDLKLTLGLTIRLFKVIHNSYHSHIHETLFESFANFYEKHLSDIESSEWPKEVFPDGKNSLVHIYKWIQKYRMENFQELWALEWDDKQHCFLYWGRKYNRLGFKLHKDGLLEIKPQEDVITDEDKELFRKKYMQIENALYDLDTEQAKWILDRRRFLLV